MADLFSGSGCDPQYLAVRSNPSFASERNECERLWAVFRPLADPNFVEEFSRDFAARFWELYLGAFLRTQHHAIPSEPSGADFEVPGPPRTFVEATNAGRGEGLDAVPPLVDSNPDDDRVRFEECVLRITSKLAAKAASNDAELLGSSAPYVIAVNLPFPEAWVGGNPPLAAQATLGVGGVSFIQDSSGAWQAVAASHPLQPRRQGCSIETTAFCNSSLAHIGALVVASVNLFSSAYADPSIEVLHNPNAVNPLPRGWFGRGTEYWVEGGRLRCAS